jgi:hypothetical protein
MAVRVDITANAQAYEQALQRLGQLQDQFEQKLRGVGQTSQRVGREERELNRARAQVLQQIMTPQERYNQKIAELDRLLGRNKLSQDQYNRAVSQAKGELDKAGESGEKAWGAKQIGNLKNYVVGITSATTAIAIVRGGLQEIIRMGEEAAAKARGAITEVGQLRQVATSQEDFEHLVGQTRAMQGMGLEESRAAQIVFAGRSAGMTDEETALLGQMEGTGFVGDTASMARNVKALQQAMGTEETGGFRDIVGKSLAASGGAPAAAEQILQASATAAGALGTLKMSDEELLAAVAQVSNVSGADQAGTQIRSLLFALGEASAKGEVDLTGADGLMGMVGTVEGMGLDDAGLQKLLGREEAITAYRLLSRNRESVAGLRARVDTATADDLLGTRMKFGDESLDAAVAARAAEGSRDVGRVGLGAQVNRADALQAFIEDSMREADYSEASIMWSTRGRRKLTDMWDPAGRAERFAGDVLEAPEDVRDTRGYRGAVGAIAADPGAYGVDTDEERRLLREAMERLGMAAEKLDHAAGALARGTRGGETLAPRDPKSDR